MDVCCGCVVVGHTDNFRYVYVGAGRGRYEESARGNFHYVGPSKGHYEKEQLPADHTWRYILLAVTVVVLMLIIVAVIHAMVEEAPFNCSEGYDNWQAGWSMMKKEYCCANEGRGCPGGAPTTPFPSDPTAAPLPSEPHWLLEWLPDLGIGAKFIMTITLCMMMGCLIGGLSLYIYVRYFTHPKKSPTELELIAEVNKLLERARGTVVVKGELQVSLMWDTKDDLDLHLTLPDGKGEISAMNKECHGGTLDVDANPIHVDAKKKLTPKPVENITWPPYSLEDPQLHPPIGDYIIWVKVYEKHDHCKDANITVVLTVSGKREVFHHRIVPGCTELKVAFFHYYGPKKGHGPGHHGAPHHDDHHNHHQGHHGRR